jgi:site-specific DNA-cytosine methylase
MDIVDLYCGIGGFSAGAMEAGCKPIAGYDCDDSALRLWSGNTGGKGVVTTLWKGRVRLPGPRANLHIHLSPPCTELSSAKRGASSETVIDDGKDAIRQALQVVLDYKYTSWSFENVSTPTVRELLDEFVHRAPDLVAYTTVDAADLGAPTTRRRLIAGPPAMIQRLRETPVHRVSVADAFAAAAVNLPAQYIKNNTRSRDGSACIRSVSSQAHTQTASHPLTWCHADGRTVRCLTVEETAIIQGFPQKWMLPTGSRAGIRGLGNAVAPPVARAVMLAACEVVGAH